ncbi:hypothetical protein HNR16_003038 [Pseudoclavibacter chungangensis]|uniref:hypothetical protein n=1 Tax=Pseudoclavibacter chungangensis TaxID=587635 RepID=UPI0017E57135|nr:hypothetical protein [Pseudoclavibacter chungangensis]NYJ68250.1 hypothetical protein [Pseudoclavibacter chungangensis]
MEFWHVVGGFWWLVFPLAGMAGGALKAWNRGADARHRRRLELLAAKRGLAAQPQGQQIAAAAPAAAAAPPAAPARASNATRAQRLTRLFAEHDEITRRWLDYELDVAKVIAFPAMTDVRQPLTSAFHRAKRRADELRPDSAQVRMDDADFEAYRDAVHDFAIAFETAEQEARRLRDAAFTPAERRRLDTARQLLQVALDQSATRAERNLAYRRARQELEGLIVLSDGAVERLEERVAMQLTDRGATASGPSLDKRPETTPGDGGGAAATPDVDRS